VHISFSIRKVAQQIEILRVRVRIFLLNNQRLAVVAPYPITKLGAQKFILCVFQFEHMTSWSWSCWVSCDYSPGGVASPFRVEVYTACRPVLGWGFPHSLWVCAVYNFKVVSVFICNNTSIQKNSLRKCVYHILTTIQQFFFNGIKDKKYTIPWHHRHKLLVSENVVGYIGLQLNCKCNYYNTIALKTGNVIILKCNTNLLYGSHNYPSESLILSR